MVAAVCYENPLNSFLLSILLPNQDPDGDGKKFKMNLRFPGQYYDVETGLFYNYFRDYNPATGRYIASDPIGLKGGLNSYGYVGGSSVGVVDPLGKNPMAVGLIYGIIFFDALPNVEYLPSNCLGKFKIRVPPPSMWKINAPLPYPFSVDFSFSTVGTPIGDIGYPTGITVTVDPYVVGFPSTGVSFR